MPHYKPSIVAHYQSEMALAEVNAFSKSPTKPRRFMEFLQDQTEIGQRYVTQRMVAHALPSLNDLSIAHDTRYVSAFINGDHELGDPEGSGIPWSAAMAMQVRYNVASLISATDAALANPNEIHLSPTSGFHHATPTGGQGFCTFSGQVIAAVKAYRRTGKRCAWFDLDGHYGNSIEDTRTFCPDLNEAIPPGFNINPMGRHAAYIASLAEHLHRLGGALLKGEIDYVCVALGADSHEWDAIGGGQCSTAEWVIASAMIFSFISSVSKDLGRPIPVVLSLFGGYRDDHPESVLALHAMGVAQSLIHLAEADELMELSFEVRKPAGVA